MTTTGPMVRDYTGGTRAIAVDVSVSAAYEILLQMFTVQNRDELTLDGPAEEFLQFFDGHASPALVEALQASPSCCELWLSMLGLVYDAEVADVDGFLGTLAVTDAVALRRRFMAAAMIDEHHGHPREAIDAAAAGDTAALDGLLTDKNADLRDLLAMDPGETLTWVVDTMRRFDAEVYSRQPDVIPALQRAAEDTRAMATTMSPEQLVERATNGVTFRPAPDIAGVVLIPSAVVRPWVVISDHGSLRIFCYPVAEEYLSGEPASPPDYVVDFYKALGDEKRLRILAILAEADAGLADLTGKLDLAKSTVHHHLRILRSAGLVRVTVGDDEKGYSLRAEALEQAGPLLQGFLDRYATTRKDT
jgi:DNA-binding transcriptional ArsR family regulator